MTSQRAQKSCKLIFHYDHLHSFQDFSFLVSARGLKHDKLEILFATDFSDAIASGHVLNILKFLIKPFLVMFRDLKHKKRELHVNIIQPCFFSLPGDSYKMKFLLHFFSWDLGCILRNPKRLKQTHILQCMNDKHFASGKAVIWLQNVLDLRSEYITIIIMFHINKLKYSSYDRKTAK